MYIHALFLERRRSSGYLSAGPGDAEVPLPIRRWQEAVHAPGIYDLEVDTSLLTSAACAEYIAAYLASGQPPSALRRLAALALSRQ